MEVGPPITGQGTWSHHIYSNSYRTLLLLVPIIRRREYGNPTLYNRIVDVEIHVIIDGVLHY
jgi:hypothetical protein